MALSVTRCVIAMILAGASAGAAYVSQRAGDAHYLQVTTSALLSNHIIGSST